VDHDQIDVAIIGAGPAGLFAAERLSAQGLSVTLFDRMPSVGRKFLMAGRGGLNLTHSEALGPFMQRYGSNENWLTPAIQAFAPNDLRKWCEGLGQPTFIGSSGRIFPEAFKASPLLRAWLARLKKQKVTIRTRVHWTGFNRDGTLNFNTPDGDRTVKASATLLALGGASWPKLGADANWVAPMSKVGIEITPLTASNCGILISWSATLRDRFSGTPLKNIALNHRDKRILGEVVITATGMEGGAVYAMSGLIRHDLEQRHPVQITVDLKPDFDIEALAHNLLSGRPKDSLSNHLRRAARLEPVAISLLYEGHGTLPRDPVVLAKAIKAVPLDIKGMAGLDRAISSAGGIAAHELDENFMLRAMPGVFVAGEMLDWDAPTGGYLLQASFATSAMAAAGIMKWINRPRELS
jgi:uncharacterized flavoprotein (TIGR03862 family)